MLGCWRVYPWGRGNWGGAEKKREEGEAWLEGSRCKCAEDLGATVLWGSARRELGGPRTAGKERGGRPREAVLTFGGLGAEVSVRRSLVGGASGHGERDGGLGERWGRCPHYPLQNLKV